MLRQTTILCLVLSALALGAGCANPVNRRTGARYYEAGFGAEERGDLMLARKCFARAYINAEIGFLGAAVEAYSLYEWARVSGYMGKREDVEWAFPRVLELIGKAKGKADNLRPPTLAEFARYLHDTGQHERAVPVFQDAVTALEARGIEERDPISFAEFLDLYAVSLRSLGRASEADTVSMRSTSLRNAHPGVSPNYMPRRYTRQQDDATNQPSPPSGERAG